MKTHVFSRVGKTNQFETRQGKVDQDIDSLDIESLPQVHIPKKAKHIQAVFTKGPTPDSINFWKQISGPGTDFYPFIEEDFPKCKLPNPFQYCHILWW